MGWWEEWKPVVAMLMVNVVLAITYILVKKSLEEGADELVLVTLRYLVATLFMLPVAYVKERNSTRPKLTFHIFAYLFLSATLGCALMHYLFYMGMQYTTAAFSCAFLNVTPVLTFLMAIPFRLETATVQTKAGIAKVLGAVLCSAGAVLLALYKGVALTSTSRSHHDSKEHSIGGKWMLGTVMLLIGTFSLSAWYLLQSKISKMFPALYTGATIMFALSFLQATALSFAIKRDVSLWFVKTKVEIITIAVSGIGGSVFCYLVILWCVEKRGSLFTTAFVPLTLIVVAGIDATVLHEQLHLGSVLGSVIVVSGLYSLLWGKNKEARTNAAKPSEYSTWLPRINKVASVTIQSSSAVSHGRFDVCSTYASASTQSCFRDYSNLFHDCLMCFRKYCELIRWRVLGPRLHTLDVPYNKSKYVRCHKKDLLIVRIPRNTNNETMQ